MQVYKRLIKNTQCVLGELRNRLYKNNDDVFVAQGKTISEAFVLAHFVNVFIIKCFQMTKKTQEVLKICETSFWLGLYKKSATKKV